MKCEVVECQNNPHRNHPHEWRVEYGAETGAAFYVTIFRGFDAERLAREYADWKMAQNTDEPSVPDPVIPKFKPGDICVCHNGIPGVVTHHVISKGISEFTLYKGVTLTADRFGRLWESKHPKLLLSLGKSYFKE